MASVIRQQFGAHPAFLNAQTLRRSLFETLAPLAANEAVTGARVVPTKWINEGIADSFWTVERVSFTNGFRDGQAMGYRTWKGKTDETLKVIPHGRELSWRLYSDPAAYTKLKQKLF
ncbi:hypothetical protein HDU81_002672 [Chytriomyces hyalinus]|nr:hypothetical protein HDU81_002672 [Chytriomyces hyalinus]